MQSEARPRAPSSGLGAWLGAPHPGRCDESNSAEETTAVGVQNSGDLLRGGELPGATGEEGVPFPIQPCLPPGSPGPPRWGPS